MFLLSLSIDRRKAIVRPLAPKNGRTCVMVSLVAIWLTSAALASPAAVFSTLVPTHKSVNTEYQE